MLAKVLSLGIHGIEAELVDVEVDIIRGLPGFTIVGLPDSSVKESKDRIRSAIENSGYEFPSKNFVVNLAPAGFKKQGSNFDLPIAIAILISSGQIAMPAAPPAMIGELSLDGSIIEVDAITAMVLSLHKHKYDSIIVPYNNRNEAASIGMCKVFPAESICNVVSILEKLPSPYQSKARARRAEVKVDFAEIVGQESVKRAAEIAAAGQHNILLYGPPGSGKSMVARAIQGILPRLKKEQALQTTLLHSCAGVLSPEDGLIDLPPFRNPHHTSSYTSIVGGGKIVSPGEITLAHNGVLFLDEFTEFPMHLLQTLRQPLEDGEITVSRVAGTFRYPSRFVLVASCNPCRCGFLFDREISCTCSNQQVQGYIQKISGPILDRIDIECYVDRVDYKALNQQKTSESSKTIRERIIECREIQKRRLSHTSYISNAQMTSSLTREHCRLEPSVEEFFIDSCKKLACSARSYFRMLRTARTIADLEKSVQIKKKHILEALTYKNLQRSYSCFR